MDGLEKSSFSSAGGSNSAGKAVIYGSSLDGNFYVTVKILVPLLEITKRLSVELQGPRKVYIIQ